MHSNYSKIKSRIIGFSFSVINIWSVDTLNSRQRNAASSYHQILEQVLYYGLMHNHALFSTLQPSCICHFYCFQYREGLVLLVMLALCPHQKMEQRVLIISVLQFQSQKWERMAVAMF